MANRDQPTLPYDILCIIARYLDSYADLRALSLASRDAYEAALPQLYRNVTISTTSLNTQRPWLAARYSRLVDQLMADIKLPNKGRARYIRTLRYVRKTPASPTRSTEQRRAGRAFGFYTSAGFLICQIPNLERLEIAPDFSQAVGVAYLPAIECSSIKELVINNTCPCDPLENTQAQDTFWEKIRSESIRTLCIHNLAPPEKRDVRRLRSKNIPACESIWMLLKRCPNVVHLDLRLRMDSTLEEYNYVHDLQLRKGDDEGVNWSLQTLRLQNLSFDAVEFNRLNPTGLRELYLPLGGRKRFFRDLTHLVSPMMFPANIESLALDCLPLWNDKKEKWLEKFDQEFVQLKLEELYVLTLKRDFFIESSRDYQISITERRMPSTKLPALRLITAFGETLKRLLLKGSWEMNIADLSKLLESCYHLEELGIALQWGSWDHDIKTFPSSIKRLTSLHTVQLLNEPRTDNMNSSWGAPLPTKHKIWGLQLDLDQGFMQIGAPQEKLRYFGIGKKMWMAYLEDDTEGRGGVRRVLREIDRGLVMGVKVLDWVRFCDECWA